MNFEVHNINRKKEVDIINNQSIISSYVSHQGQKVKAEDETRKITEGNGDPSRQYRMRRRSYELTLL